MFQDGLLEELHKVIQNIHFSTKDSIHSAFKKSIEHSKNGEYKEAVEWASIIEEWCWERLHSGHWKDVPVDYRRLYSLAIAMKGYSLKEMGNYQEAIGAIDKGLLLGAPIREGLLHKMADTLTELITHKEEVSSSNTTSCSEQTISEPAAKRSLSPNNSITVPEKKVKTEPCNHDDSVTITSQYTSINRIHCPSLERFHTHYMKQVKPVILTGCMDHWPAMNNRRWRWVWL